MKVLYFHQHFSTPRGATGTRSYEIARRLVECGHDVTLICGSGQNADSGLEGEPVGGVRRGEVDGIQVIEICLRYSNYDGLLKRSVTFLRYAWKSVFIAAREHYDVLFATSTPLTASIPGIVMRLWKPRKKFVFEVRDLWPELPKTMGVVKNPVLLTAMSALEKMSYLAMHGGVALSPGILEGMRRRSTAAKPIAMVPNGCDLEMFRPQREEAGRSDFALPAGFPRDGFRCIFAGAHGIANGLDSVLDAARVLMQRRQNAIRFIFVGDGKLKPHLLERCQREQLTNCLFLAPMPKEKLCHLLNHVEVGLMILANVPAFYYGTSPNKFFDYIASGLPVLNNYPGWLADLIEENGCGATVPPDDPTAFADALTRLAADRVVLGKMGRKARELAEREFGRNSLCDRFIQFLEHISGDGSVAGGGPHCGGASQRDGTGANVVLPTAIEAGVGTSGREVS